MRKYEWATTVLSDGQKFRYRRMTPEYAARVWEVRVSISGAMNDGTRELLNASGPQGDKLRDKLDKLARALVDAGVERAAEPLRSYRGLQADRVEARLDRKAKAAHDLERRVFFWDGPQAPGRE